MVVISEFPLIWDNVITKVVGDQKNDENHVFLKSIHVNCNGIKEVNKGDDNLIVLLASSSFEL